jgi:hypothetical protein
MRKLHRLAIPFVVIVSVIPGAWYFASRAHGDQLSDTLRSLGYLPINPPSNLMNLGSLYYLDSDVKFFKTICRADADDLNDAVIKSPSTKTLADELDSGNYSIGIKLAADTVGSQRGNVADNYVRKVHYSLTDVQLYEIPLGANRKIYSKLMARGDCSDAVWDNIDAGGYVCQGQQIMEATVEYDLKLEGEKTTKAAGDSDVSAVAEAVKVAVQAESGAQLIEKAGRFVTGSSLEYGIAMNPTCLAPPHARFERILPASTLGKFINFVKFRVLEPILPGT